MVGLLALIPGARADPSNLQKRLSVPMVAADGAPATPTPPPAPAAVTFILNEVHLVASSAVPAFAELKNVGAAAASPAGLILAGPGSTFTVPSGAPGVEPGGVLAIVFDGAGTASANEVHIPATAIPSGAGATLDLKASGTVLDHFSWAGIAQAAGGAVSPPTAGAAAARDPAAGAASASWQMEQAAQATPGTPNLAIGVSAFGVTDRSVFLSSMATLSWYSHAGATAYRVEVATDSGFAHAVSDQTMAATEPGSLTQEYADVGPLENGWYYWRVTAIKNGVPSAPSAAQSFAVAGGSQAQVAVAASQGTQLPVPHLFQRKDTNMLHLDNAQEDGDLAWDRPDPEATHHRPYCTRAAAAMVNHYFGGDLSLDRIGYQEFKDLAPGPEQDLAETGVPVDQFESIASWALSGAAITEHEMPLADDTAFIATLKTEIDAGRPVFIWEGNHVEVAVGYVDNPMMDGVQIGTIGVYMEDGNAPVRMVIGDASYPLGRFIAFYLTIAPGAAGIHQEAGVTADSDGDGVVDFDETERFHTSPANPDSDSDGVHDKEEIRASVWDEKYGYHYGGGGRDSDGDGKWMESDPDSDNGGCLDGMEDKNKNGHRNDTPDETSVFDAEDDSCYSGTFINSDITDKDEGSAGHYHEEQLLTITISMEPQADGSLAGIASAVYTAFGSLDGGSACSHVSQPLVTVAWQGTLTGSIENGNVGFHMAPGSKPFTLVTTGCGITQMENDTTPGFTGWSGITFDNGVYHSHQPYSVPLLSQNGFLDMTLRQPGVH